jgi:hypothetical protein
MESEELKYYLQCSRIRSLRNKKRLQREDFDKTLIRLHKEEMVISKARRNLGWTELIPPVQRGFIRSFVLRDDVKRTRQSSFFEAILKKINTSQWSYRRDFKRKRRKFGKKVYVVREQGLRDIGEAEFFGRKFNEMERFYFYETLTQPTWSRIPIKVYRFIESWRFVLHVQPNMITQVRIKDLDLEKRDAEISKYFTHDRRHRLWKLLDGSVRWKWDHVPKKKYEDPLNNKSFADILSEYIPEPQSMQLVKNPRTPRVSFLHLIQIKKHPGARALTVIFLTVFTLTLRLENVRTHLSTLIGAMLSCLDVGSICC